jgi:uncharacterized protein (DUF983 family)
MLHCVIVTGGAAAPHCRGKPVSDQIPVRWQPEYAEMAPPWPMPPLLTAIRRGLANRCPACGKTHLFRGYLKVRPECAACGAPLGEFRADDAPPYFTIFAVGHIVVPLMFMMEQAYKPPLWVHAAIWLPLTVILTLAMLRPIKGGTVGLMLRLNMLKTADE